MVGEADTTARHLECAGCAADGLPGVEGGGVAYRGGRARHKHPHVVECEVDLVALARECAGCGECADVGCGGDGSDDFDFKNVAVPQPHCGVAVVVGFKPCGGVHAADFDYAEVGVTA